ncbi:MAG: hypothetical protein R3F45_02190 [Gammaproteobacteria bacterium]
MSLVEREIQAIAKQLGERDLSPELYSKLVERLRSSIQPSFLNGPWSNVISQIKPETLTALAFCAEILDDEEVAIDAEELGEIERRVSELEALVEHSNVPESIVLLVRHHIGLIRRGLAWYPICGAKALRESAHIASGELLEAQETVRENSGTETVTKLRELWRVVNATTDVALKGDKLVALFGRIMDAISGW